MEKIVGYVLPDIEAYICRQEGGYRFIVNDLEEPVNPRFDEFFTDYEEASERFDRFVFGQNN